MTSTGPADRARALFVLCLVILAWPCAHAGDTFRADIEPRVCAALKDGRQLFLECRPPKGDAAQQFFAQYLAWPDEWRMYKDRIAVAIRFESLKPEVQRRVLFSVFRQDYVDEAGWWHTAIGSDKTGQELLWSLCEWLTGKGTNYRAVMADKRNHLSATILEQGQRVLIPTELLLPVMKTPSPKPTPEQEKEEAKTAAEEKPPDLDAVANKLRYGSDAKGPYAMYRLKPGEALYTAVVVRFTDIRDNDAIQHACDAIQKRSGIKNVHGMKTGQKIIVPLAMLSDRFTPKDSEPRKEYEQNIVEAKRLREEQVRTKDLDGVVVVIDPGHGGRDRGCSDESLGLYEDKINYDIACRVKKILETQTRAKVYMTVMRKRQGYEPSDKTHFSDDNGTVVLTTPPYHGEDAKISANLRWYLANAFYQDELGKGTDPRKMVFTSFHTDALFNASLRGTMIYIPGAKYRREHEEYDAGIYARFKEVREHPVAASTDAERRRDEALSRNFAENLMEALGQKRVRRHLEGDWIRSQIRQDGGRVYVPAVLRNTLIPTKILIETANMTNKTDCQNLADPQWRQTFAEAYCDALRVYFKS